MSNSFISEMAAQTGAMWVKLAVLLLVSLGLSACASSYQGPVRPHFDGKVFLNPGMPKDSSVLGYLWLRLTTSQAVWPKQVDNPMTQPPPVRVAASEARARVTMIGHATLLIQVGGLNILTDPVWAQRASPLSWVGPKRVSPPALALKDLPPIDLVLISHNHYDHLDLPTLARLHERDRPRVIVPLGNASLVQQAMPQSIVSEHDWGETVQVVKPEGTVTVHIEPMVHSSGRSPFDQMRALWAAYVIESAGLKIFHAGDTGYGKGTVFRAAGQKHGGFDLALLPIGAYEPVAFMADSHMRASDAVHAMKDLNAKRALAHHHETFQLGFEAFDAPRLEIQAALQKNQLPPRAFALPRPGEFEEILKDTK
jgi:L-ascorbate metabolism protein UlaG (beta-lactamase superfamily)